MICSINGCEDKIHSRGWCQKHYTRWYRHNDPEYTKTEMHGYWGHPLYKVWTEMKQRCYNSNHKHYKDWGGRGIKVCKEWMSPKIFIEWCLDNGWRKGLEIDRLDNDGNYEPKNCRFVTSKENNLNKRLLMSTNTSGYRGVSYFKRDKKWESYIRINNKTKHLGLFNTPELAALAYDNAVIDNRPRNFK